ncbi:MAG: bifunctional aspartate kinase/homoserine dehydrogenase I [Muricauda sp.]|nr:bifunctional aspartate kinase/homoserine dehydrogenase I [Allomuricauda sp.]MAU27037.1 bifunctional aspartate kinase/homoserine dehydrogenase I [Allomuricauda sp.]MBC30773.1 bifunctional aspartate kinase/homoserine dehydrogenase I [Allomuricauda sp.]|tara:strand:- start:15960 stop:18404 length:2445 start_codon:yes stop_codon:yes gene_type:complete
MKVLKFGGTSVANAANIQRVKSIVENTKSDRVFVVVSALGGITDLLMEALNRASKNDKGYAQVLEAIEKRHLETVKALFPPQAQSAILGKVKTDLNALESMVEGALMIGEITPGLSDKVVSHGELLSSFIIAEFLKKDGLDAIFKDSRELIVTDETHGRATVYFNETQKNCKDFFNGTSQKIVVLPGFIAASKSGKITTLGRGGSDYTAAILAGALDAEVLEIWTDVSGMFTANPKLVKQAKCIEHISFEEAMELSHFGAKVLYAPTIQPVLAKAIPIHIKNTFAPEDTGTLISKNQNGGGKTVKGISHVGNITLLSLEGPGMVGIPGISKRFFETLFLENISVVLITQASSEHSICVGISDIDAEKAEKAVNDAFELEISAKRIKPAIVESDLAIIALVGDNMKNHQGLSGKMFSALGKNNVNIRAIAQGASERNISAVIGKEDVKKALNTLHEAFFEEQVKQLNLFIIGVGNVGSRLLQQLQQQKKYLKKELKLNVRVIGLSNSSKMVFDEDGLDLRQWTELLDHGQHADPNLFFKAIKKLNYRNSILVDNTASESVANSYGDFLKESISVVTCNKIACSSDYAHYSKLKQLSKEYNAPFLFETNVGAGLPIIDTLKHLIASGDKVHKIQAVLSGSLNFVFNNFSSDVTFHDIVKKAQEGGYTEPDPKIDLSGIDVMRKILILARESGYQLDIDDIENESFLPEESLRTSSNDEFFASLKRYESHFQNIYQQATSKKCRLKYVAQFEDGKARVGLQHIPEGHDFYNLEGSDNIVLFYTDRYIDQPLIIKGAGAGADVTASGIFADIVRIGNF